MSAPLPHCLSHSISSVTPTRRLRVKPPPNVPEPVLFEATLLFWLIILANMLCRQTLLRILLKVDTPLARVLLLFFPSTKPAHELFEHADSASKRPQIRRCNTTGAGALPQAISADVLPTNPGSPRKSSLAPEQADEEYVFRSVVFVAARDAARIALPPIAAALLLTINVSLAASISARRYAPAHLAFAIEPVLRVSICLRLLVPVDPAINFLVEDVLAKYKVFKAVRHNFWYLAVALRLVLWVLSLSAIGAVFGWMPRTSALQLWGIVGVGAALSMQQAAQDLFRSFQLMLYRPFSKGDVIDVGNGHFGMVKEVNLAHTKLELFDRNQIAVIPSTVLASVRRPPRAARAHTVAADPGRRRIRVASRTTRRWRSAAAASS